MPAIFSYWPTLPKDLPLKVGDSHLLGSMTILVTWACAEATASSATNASKAAAKRRTPRKRGEIWCGRIITPPVKTLLIQQRPKSQFANQHGSMLARSWCGMITPNYRNGQEAVLLKMSTMWCATKRRE